MASNVNTTNSTSSTVEVCLPVQDKILMLSMNERLILATLFASSFLSGAPLNILVAVLIKTTRQTENQSTRLIMQFSIADSVGATFINCPYFCYMVFYESIKCKFLLILHTFVNLGIETSLFMTAFIGFDRYMRVRYLNEYGSKFTESRFKICHIICASMIFIQTVLIFCGIYFFGYGYATILTAPLHIILFTGMLLCYGFSIQKLRAHRQENRRISNNDRSVVTVASTY